MIESNRIQDAAAEKSLGEYMDKYFYSKLKYKDGSPIRFERSTNRNLQLKGVDVRIETEDDPMIIDEKASFYYCNQMIPTFAFELDSIQEGHADPVLGWFINDELETQYYMLIWPNIKCVNRNKQWLRKEVSEIKRDDFTIVETMLVRKKDIRSFLEYRGYDRSRLLKYAREYREKCSASSSKEKEELMHGISIVYSGYLAEKPINLVISKNILKKLAKAVYLVSSDGYASIKDS